MILDEWIAELPQEFQGKDNINVLITALSKQMQEIQQVFDDLDNDTGLLTAEGENLDNVGTIIPMSRRKATSILKKQKDTVITDDFYRKVLKYTSLKNSCDCTYEDIMGAITLLWETDKITYREPSNRPATVLLDISDVNIDGSDPAENSVLTIKPAGVAIYYAYAMYYALTFTNEENFGFSCYYPSLVFDGKKLMDGSILMDADYIQEVL